VAARSLPPEETAPDSSRVTLTPNGREMLTARLRKLEDGGVITRQQYTEHPPRYDYMLTEAGQALVPGPRTLRRWGEKYAPSRPA
jgi:DNA-binding HxlR family transcriptional regulator